ncbi:MAG: YdbH domain-containing protein [Proteobacteria bacterium]|nr:YdbH domain-containing protein [Pseudomonadota bacterium]
MGRLGKSLLKLTLLLGLVLAAGLVWREVVVETAARLVLSSSGLSDAQFEVVAVGRSGIVIENVSLGAGLLSARRMRLSYDPADLFAGRLRDLRIEGLRLDLRQARDGTLARLEALASGAGGPWVELPKIVLENAEIVLAAPFGGAIAIDGELDLSGAGLGAVLEIGLDLGHTTAAFTVRSRNLDQGGVAEISGGGESELAGLALPGPMGATATGGRARFTVEGTVQIPAGDAASPRSWLAGALSLKGDLRLDQVTTSAGPAVLSADIGWALGGGDGGLRLELPRSAKLTVQGIAPGTLAALHLAVVDGAAPDFAVELSSSGPVLAWSPRGDGGVAEVAGDLAVTLGDATVEIRVSAKIEHDAAWRLSAPAAIRFRAGASAISLAGAQGSALLGQVDWSGAGSLAPDGEVELHGSLGVKARDVDLAEVKIGAVELHGDVRLRWLQDRWSLAVTPGLTIALEGIAAPGRLEIAEPVLLSVDSLEASGGDALARLELSASASQVSGVLLGGEGKEVAFADAGGRITLVLAPGDRGRGEVRLEDARVTLPGEAVGLSAVSATLPLGAAGDAGGDAAGIVLSGEVRDTGRAARFRAFRIDLEGTRDGETVAVSGAIETLDRMVRLPLKGSADLAAMTGRIKLGPTRIRFRKGGRQPRALSPKLAALRDVAGAVRVSAALELRADGAVRSWMTLRFDDLSARVGDIEVAGLEGTVKFNRLSPLATAGPQLLTARRLTVGVPVDGPRVRFTILPRRRGLAVQIHDAAGELAGGEISIEDARWDSRAKTNAFEVRVRDVAIGRLLRDWQVEGISGTGRLSGLIPVRIGRAGLAVAGGRLDSAGAGTIRVDWGAARETLVAAGEQVALAVDALEDFRYDSLSIGIDQPEDGALTLAIGMAGSNPAVFDGHPIQFNINLSGDLAPILAAVREGRRIGAALLQGGFGGQ